MPKKIDLTGKVFSGLTVIREAMAHEKRWQGSGANWICACECGTPLFVTSGAQLLSGKAQSCGCLKKARWAKPIDVTGMRFGILTAISHDHATKQGSYWRFKCDCGKEAVKRLKDVRYGNTASCGCNKASKINRHHIDVNRPWRKSDAVDDRWLVIVGACDSRMTELPTGIINEIVALLKKRPGLKSREIKDALSHITRHGISTALTIERRAGNVIFAKKIEPEKGEFSGQWGKLFVYYAKSQDDEATTSMEAA